MLRLMISPFFAAMSHFVDDVNEILTKFRASNSEKSSEMLLDQLNQAFWLLYEDYRVLNVDGQERSMGLEEYLNAQRVFHNAGLIIIEQITKGVVPEAANEERSTNESGQPSPMETESAANQDAVSDDDGEQSDGELLIMHELSDDEMMSSLVNDSVEPEKFVANEQSGSPDDVQPSTGAIAVAADGSKVPKQRRQPAVDKRNRNGNRGGSNQNEVWRDINNLPYLQYEKIFRPLFELPKMTEPSVAKMDRVLNALTMVLKQAADSHLSTLPNHKMLIALVQNRIDETSRQIWLFQLDVEPTLDDLVNFLAKRSTFLKATQRHCESIAKCRQVQKEQKEQAAATTASTSQGAHSLLKKKKVICACCGSEHYLHRCDMFKTFKLADKVAVLKRNGLCMNCFSTAHKTQECKQGVCHRCNVKHNSLLCSRLHPHN